LKILVAIPQGIIRETFIPADEVIDAMKSVGNLMSPLLKETSQGGIAVCRTAIAIEKGLQ